ncbi:MAG: hypothetical protein HOE48_04035 [Candidatus Latescibacteria bacterium]|nr:hypothetical protein [Candidatus Latescibacterota bacterium]
MASILQPLIDNPGIELGDSIYMANTPLSPTAINQQIPTPESRGVTVHLQ